MNLQVILDLLSGTRKEWGIGLAIVGVVVLAALGRLEMPQAIDTIKWLISTWVGAVALETAAEKMGPRGGINVSVTPTGTSASMVPALPAPLSASDAPTLNPVPAIQPAAPAPPVAPPTPKGTAS
jgi:hypothetical protein